MGGIRTASFGYMDQMKVLSEYEEDIIIVDGVFRAFEEVPGPSLTETARQFSLASAPWRAARFGPSPGSMQCSRPRCVGFSWPPVRRYPGCLLGT
jgi:hypothetical protein